MKINRKLLEKHHEREKCRPVPRLKLDPEALRWTPIVSTQMLRDEESRTEWEVRRCALLNTTPIFFLSKQGHPPHALYSSTFLLGAFI